MLYYLRKALTLPPHIVLQKIGRKIKSGYLARKKFRQDQNQSTYTFDCPYSKLHRFSFNPPNWKVEERFLRHEFNLLGSGWVAVARKEKGHINEKNRAESNRIANLISPSYVPIDWHIDFKSGYRWKEDTWSEHIQYGSVLGADVKVPWELARMQHLVFLPFTKQGAEEFQNQILDFIASNPPRFGVNWVCTMDVGIRIANWLIAYDLFLASGAKFNPEFESIFIRSVYEHAHHIIHHLEWDPYLRSNHYLANIAGLLFASAYLGADEWFDFSVRELISETLSQFHSDGSNFEASTSYHRLSAEMVFYSTSLALKKGGQFPEEYLERIEKMKDFIRDTTKPDGTSLQFGDNDSGRFVKLFDFHEKTLKAHVLYPDFGLSIHQKGPWFLAVRCGSIGQKGNGGHAHNDQLSFELSVDGLPAIIDPGTYLYTPDPSARRHFRSTAMHNTLAVRGKEQNKDDGLFKMVDLAKAKLIHSEEGLWMGEHTGFGPVHRRTLRIHEDYLEGIDECEAEEKEIFFHLAPGAEKVRISSSDGEFSKITDWVSKAYGEKEKASVLILRPFSNRCVWRIEKL